MNKTILILLLVVAYTLPFAISLVSVLSGSIPFWYDPARDLLSAVANLSNPTLIGPPSGIPGIFYGPYWIWGLSLGTLVSKDPRIVALFVQLLPYFIFLPLIFFKFKRIFSPLALVTGWLFFTLEFSEYTTRLWNPYIAPLLFVIVVYLLTITPLSVKTPRSKITMSIAGFIAGLAMNFHISFGIGLITGSLVFLLLNVIYHIVSRRRKIITSITNYGPAIVLFLLGIAVSYVPFLLFEFRNGFNQIKTVIATLTASGAVVSQIGLTKDEIIKNFFGSTGTLLHLSSSFGFIAGIALLCISLYLLWKARNKFSIIHKPIILVITILFTVLSIYLLSKNPVWEYHFINVEIIFLFLLLYVLTQYKILRIVAFAWVIVVSAIYLSHVVSGFSAPQYAVPDLKTKEHIVKTIVADAGSTPYTVLVYNPSIYTYDYSYLFQWLGNKEVPFDPGQIIFDTDVAYLIIEKTSDSVHMDFLNNRTPDSEFQTSKKWIIPDGTTIYKRVKLIH